MTDIYSELRKTELEMFDETIKKTHNVLMDVVRVYGNVFYRISDVYAITNEELK